MPALSAELSSLIFFAILLRTGSIIPPIIYPMLWDFATFLVTAGNTSPPAAVPQAIAYFVPLLFVLPNALAALFLLRNIGKASTT